MGRFAADGWVDLEDVARNASVRSILLRAMPLLAKELLSRCRLSERLFYVKQAATVLSGTPFEKILPEDPISVLVAPMSG